MEYESRPRELDVPLSKSVIYKEAALPIPPIVSPEILAPPCVEEGAAMDKPPWCSKSTGHFLS